MTNQDRAIFDNRLVELRQVHALARADPNAGFLVEHLLDELRDRVGVTNRTFENAYLVHGLAPGADDLLRAAGNIASLRRIEPPFVVGERVIMAGQRDRLPLASASADLIVIPFALHWSNDLLGMLAEVQRVLQPDGLFLAAMPATGTLAELRQSLISAEAGLGDSVMARVDPFIEIRQAGALLQRAGFALPVADLETVNVSYRDPRGLVADLRAMGATCCLNRPRRARFSRHLFERAFEFYRQDYRRDDGRFAATFAFAMLTGWAPHESQQIPLRPGSANRRLSDVLRKNQEN